MEKRPGKNRFRTFRHLKEKSKNNSSGSWNLFQIIEAKMQIWHLQYLTSIRGGGQVFAIKSLVGIDIQTISLVVRHGDHIFGGQTLRPIFSWKTLKPHLWLVDMETNLQLEGIETTSLIGRHVDHILGRQKCRPHLWQVDMFLPHADRKASKVPASGSCPSSPWCWRRQINQQINKSSNQSFVLAPSSSIYN